MGMRDAEHHLVRVRQGSYPGNYFCSVGAEINACSSQVTESDGQFRVKTSRINQVLQSIQPH